MSKKIINTISLSSGVAGDETIIDRYNIGVKRVKRIFSTHKVVPTLHSLKGEKILSKNPRLRAEDFQSCLDREDRLLISNIGGFDSHKLIPLIDKIDLKYCNIELLGFSDTTSFHLFLIQYNKTCYYGPSILDGFAENHKMHEYTKKYLTKAFSGKKYSIISSNEWTSQYLEWNDPKNQHIKRKMQKEDDGFIFVNPQTENVESSKGKGKALPNLNELNKNVIQGKLIGGCLDTIFKIKDLSFFPGISFWRNSIIFLETSEEEPNPEVFRKYLSKIKEELSVCNAVLFGKPKNERYYYEYLNILKDVLGQMNKPFIYNMNFGHNAPFSTLPYQRECKIDFPKKKITILKRN